MSLRSFSKRVGIDRGTLLNWSNSIEPNSANPVDIKLHNIKESNKDKNWSPQEKFNAVIKYAHLDEVEKGKFLRQNGLYSSNIKKWQNEMKSGISLGGKKLSKIDKYEKELKSQKAIIDLQKKIKNTYQAGYET